MEDGILITREQPFLPRILSFGQVSDTLFGGCEEHGCVARQLFLSYDYSASTTSEYVQRSNHTSHHSGIIRIGGTRTYAYVCHMLLQNKFIFTGSRYLPR